MAGQTEPGHIRHRMGDRGQQGRGRAKRAGHVGIGPHDRLTQNHARNPRHHHFGRHDRPGSQGFGQDQLITDARPGLGHRPFGKAGHGEADRQFRADRRMPAHDIGPGGAEHGHGFVHDFGQHPGLHRFGQAGQGDLGEGDLRFRPHGPDIAQGMHGRDPGQKARVVAKGAQMVGGDDLHAILGLQQRGIIAGTRDHIGALGAGQGGKGGGQT